MSEIVARTNGEMEMIGVGIRIGQALKAGDVVGLTGQLGAGKTHLCKGIVSGLGSRDTVTSPTFSLVQEYRSGPLHVYHFDFYRLETEEEAIRLGWDEYLDDDAVVIVEWADKFPRLLPERSTWFELTIGKSGEHIVSRK